MLKEFPSLRQARFENHFPHVAMDMMDPSTPRPTRPHRGEKRNSVPDFDNPVTGTQTSEQFADNGCGEHHEAAMFANDSVAVASSGIGMALGIGGAHRDVDSRLGPEGKDPSCMELRTPGFDIDEISPGKNVNSLDASILGESRDIAD
ncbi:unannotated protein [freshwater metagenome]|uniref:Unannotated protein n=1 Tax=freshwater metagenome TaxID=449393 RepID=A0A6J6FLJ1_9ZZZZ